MVSVEGQEQYAKVSLMPRCVLARARTRDLVIVVHRHGWFAPGPQHVLGLLIFYIFTQTYNSYTSKHYSSTPPLDCGVFSENHIPTHLIPNIIWLYNLRLQGSLILSRNKLNVTIYIKFIPWVGCGI